MRWDSGHSHELLVLRVERAGGRGVSPNAPVHVAKGGATQKQLVRCQGFPARLAAGVGELRRHHDVGFENVEVVVGQLALQVAFRKALVRAQIAQHGTAAAGALVCCLELIVVRRIWGKREGKGKGNSVTQLQ